MDGGLHGGSQVRMPVEQVQVLWVGGEVEGHRTFLGTPRSPRAGAATGGGADGEENSH